MDFDFSKAGLPPLRLVRQLDAGENNYSFIYADGGGRQYVVRRKKEFSGTGPLSEERQMLLFLEASNIPFAPRSIYHDADTGFHIITYVDGKDLRPFEFDAKLAAMFGRQLAQVHRVTRASYENWCKAQGLTPRPPEMLEDNLRQYFDGPAQTVAAHCPDKTLAAWAAQDVAACLGAARARPQHPATFVHGDLGGNMRWDGQRLWFIDWERARFLHLGELGYIFVHGECPAPIRKNITEAYAGALGLSPAARDALDEQTAFETELLRIDKVLWRANKFTELHRAGVADAEKYRLSALEALAALQQDL